MRRNDRGEGWTSGATGPRVNEVVNKVFSEFFDQFTFAERTADMDFLKRYLERAAEIIGDRTPGEERYDRELIRWLEKGKPIKKAIAKANEKYPDQALRIDDALLADVQAHYEYLLEHERIMRRLNR